MSLVPDVFSEQGLLAAHIPGYQSREAQLHMASAVEEAVINKQKLVVEAGTGTGKTMAYLAPALLSESEKTIVSTGTKALQEQLFLKDVPLLRKALKHGKHVALLKGRANYLCLHRFDQYGRGSFAFERTQLNQLNKVKKWSEKTKAGDIGEIEELEENASILPFVTSTADNCLGSDCPQYQECYLLKARRRAMDADVVVVNHHLFFADMAIKDTGFGELIPNASTVIFDEAHQLPDIASEHFGESVSTRQILDLANEIQQQYKTELTDASDLQDVAADLIQHYQDFRESFYREPEKQAWRFKAKDPQTQQQLQILLETLRKTYDVLKTCISRTKEIDTCYDRCGDYLSTLNKFRESEIAGYGCWYETTRKHVILRITPLHIADKFAEFLDKQDCSWIFTSATLAVDGSFEHYNARMGIKKPQQLHLSSPFDYQNQAVLCVPRYLPEPSEPTMIDALVDISVKLINASKGRCFLLFTSYRVLDKVAEKLLQACTNPLLIQGTTSKQALLKKFVKNEQAVLLGTSSFWEGVDVRGDSLICVLIDKLPFAAPDDPLLEARIQDCKSNGGDPFQQIQLPQSVIALKQGAGRLIRDKQDKGVLVICDNRLVTRQYGQTFLGSLPDMALTRDVKKATDFLQQILD